MYEKILKLEPQDFKKMIHQMQEVNIVLLAKNESLDQIIFYDSLISSYFKTNQLDKAGIYSSAMYPSIIMTLMDHIDIAYRAYDKFTNFFRIFVLGTTSRPHEIRHCPASLHTVVSDPSPLWPQPRSTDP